MSRIIDELIAKGRAEGAAAKTKDFAEKLLLGTDFSFEKISELTGLSSEKVSELKATMSKAT